ncbi:multifunctional methyltransferase subunit TRM112-like protein isoform X1 [Stegodyphus dumicola]|uniref:multifunctional methyltransferase subunit TRM112-like protein isoform X1 n=1 Tax=Stegodyphus dumicola TaxID=202533 RepID=UPI0015A89958|nr:multifunctional methyltransferase subunit TRM112-like protein isoform X1 [Stegodyphus dumicola]
MKLLTHNFLTSKCLKRVNVGFPLGIVVKEVQEVKVDFNADFISKMIPKLDWDVVYTAANTVGLGCANEIPKSVSPNFENDEEFLRKAHHVLLEVELMSGELVCPETGVKFPVSNGIPNMLANEDEV